MCVRCDVTNEDDLTALYDGCEKHFGGKVDIFCNNAGINHTAGWKKCMQIDIVSRLSNSLELGFQDYTDRWR